MPWDICKHSDGQMQVRIYAELELKGLQIHIDHNSLFITVFYLGLKGVLVVPVSESIWACNRLQIWPTGTRFLTGEVIPGVAALKSWTK